MLSETNFIDVNLSNTKGLENCAFYGPCTLDRRTSSRSGPLPVPFLQGCGLQDWEVESAKLYDLTLTNDQFIDIQQRIYDLCQGPAIQYQSLFISYSIPDEAIDKKIHSDLQSNGVRCWFAPKDLKIGQKIRRGITQAIQKHERAMVILSKQSVTSTWVQAEVETALDK